jgi:hypothetical protein
MPPLAQTTWTVAAGIQSRSYPGASPATGKLFPRVSASTSGLDDRKSGVEVDQQRQQIGYCLSITDSGDRALIGGRYIFGWHFPFRVAQPRNARARRETKPFSYCSTETISVRRGAGPRRSLRRNVVDHSAQNTPPITAMTTPHAAMNMNSVCSLLQLLIVPAPRTHRSAGRELTDNG